MESTYVPELYGITEEIIKWRQNLMGQRFIIHTDHYSLKNLINRVIQTPEQHQYLNELLSFSYLILYKRARTWQPKFQQANTAIPHDGEEHQLFFLIKPQFDIIDSLKLKNEFDEEIYLLHKRWTRLASTIYFQERSIIWKGRLRLSSTLSLTARLFQLLGSSFYA